MVYRTSVNIAPNTLQDLTIDNLDKEGTPFENYYPKVFSRADLESMIYDDVITTDVSAAATDERFTFSSTGFNTIQKTFTEILDLSIGDIPLIMTPSTDVSVLSNGTNSYAIKDAQARSDIADLQTNKVPTTRTVNGKALSSDITLTASDVGALSSISSSDVTNALGYTPLQSSDISNMVTTDTDQTIIGKKVLDGKDKTMLANTNITKGTNPASTQYINFGLFGDTTSSYTDRLGCMETSIDSSGNVTTYMRAYKNTASSSTEGHITVNYPASGSPYATCPTPTEDTNNSVQIDTVGARNTKLAGYVDTSTNQNIGGTKRFTDSVQSQYAWNISRDDFTKGDIPTSTKYFGIMGLDALPQDSSSTAWQDKRLGIVESAVDTNGTTTIYMRAYKNATQANGGSGNFGITITYPQTGSAYANITSSPSTTDNSTKIATTSYTRSYTSSRGDLVLYGTSSTGADTVAKVVDLSTDYNPSNISIRAGQLLVVKPTTTSTVADSTLKVQITIDGTTTQILAAKTMKYNNTNITTSTDSVVWNANYPSIFVYDGTNWVFLGHGVDSNTTYSAMSVAEGTTGTATSQRTMRADYLKDIITARITTQITGYNASKTQTLKNVNGTLKWVDD